MKIRVADSQNTAIQYCAKVMQTIIDENRALFSQFIAVIRETSHGLPNVKTINQCDISTIFAISRQDNYCSSETSLQRFLAKQNDISPRYIVTAKFVVKMS